MSVTNNVQVSLLFAVLSQQMALLKKHMTLRCKNSVGDEHLYSPEILKKLNFNKCKVKFEPPITVQDPGENLIVRPLCIEDYNRGYPELLSQLTKVGDLTELKFKETFHTMKACKNCYYITVVEDTITNQVIGTATLAIELKFIHSAGLRCRLEDVVINDNYRGRQLGKLLVCTVLLLAESLGGYKITLDCKDVMVKFYSHFGFVRESGNSNMMTIRFKD